MSNNEIKCKIKAHHITTVRQLLGAKPKSPVALDVIDNCIMMRMTRLHRCWFSSSRRERQA